MKNKKSIVVIAVVVILIILGIVYYLNFKNNNLIKLNYNEVMEKIDNKEDFILCVSAKKCIHCKKYKPKLKEIASNYDIQIYYVNVNEFNDDNYETFKSKFSFDGSTPTTILFKDGEEKTTASRIEGNEKIEKVIGKLKSNGFITE